MSKGSLCCLSADHFTILVILLSTIVISGLAGPRLSLEASDAMDHAFFGGQLRSDTLPLAACNPDYEAHYLNCVMTLPNSDAASRDLSAHALQAMDELTAHYHTTLSSICFRPRDAKLTNSAMMGNRTLSGLSDFYSSAW
ncbi:hypothetical protein PoB_001626400 [Plakobranchus ocellatus]|uniref:Uncharacterized protein n=1 Tax=Plakobranchus ocellatus TaxID=259542 RepID=A0AAV3Z383_9GAST|nr:hypothetical protein PoB_001626400 [Plakobranchus ocellatus]